MAALATFCCAICSLSSCIRSTLPEPSQSWLWITASKTSRTRTTTRATMASLEQKARQRRLATQVVERGTTGVFGHIAQVFFNAQQLVVLGDAVRAAHRTGLDLTSVQAHSDVGNRAVFGFARAVRDHGGVTGALGHFDGSNGFGQCAD